MASVRVVPSSAVHNIMYITFRQASSARVWGGAVRATSRQWLADSVNRRCSTHFSPPILDRPTVIGFSYENAQNPTS